MPYRMRDPAQIAAEFAPTASPTPSSSTKSRLQPRYLRELCRALRPLNKIWSAAVSIDVTDDPA